MQTITFTKEYKVAPQKKNAELTEAVDKVRSMINEERQNTTYKPLNYVTVYLKLKRAGYTTAHKIELLLGGIKDAENPVKTLFWNLKVKTNIT